MDWEKINALLEVVHKSAGVPEANWIRNEALATLKVLNAAAGPKPLPYSPPVVEEQPELPGTRRTL